MKQILNVAAGSRRLGEEPVGSNEVVVVIVALGADGAGIRTSCRASLKVVELLGLAGRVERLTPRSRAVALAPGRGELDSCPDPTRKNDGWKPERSAAGGEEQSRTAKRRHAAEGDHEGRNLEAGDREALKIAAGDFDRDGGSAAGRPARPTPPRPR